MYILSQYISYKVNQDVLQWAIKESQKNVAEIKDKYPKINDWIDGSAEPTLRQLENLANYLKIPFGYMFLQRPPKDDFLKAEFRSINNKAPHVSKNLKDTLLEMDSRQSWMSEYRKNLGWEKLDIISKFNANVSERTACEDIAQCAKDVLEIDPEWFAVQNTYEKAYAFLREKLENAGVMVMQNGTVGFDTHRKLDLNEFRAFMLYDEIAPLIFINAADTTPGKIFSLIHEYIHILFQQEDILLDSDAVEIKENEQRINKITAEFLMPTGIVVTKWKETTYKTETAHIESLAKLFKVSNYALSIRLAELGIVSRNMVTLFAQRANNRKHGGNGGDFYATYYSRMSPSFLHSVISQAEAGNLSYTYAYKLLGGIKSSMYSQIRGKIYG